MHEVGHNRYKEHKEENENEQESASFLGLIYASKISNKEKLAETLREERYADAYMLNTLRPVIEHKGFSSEAIFNLIHNNNLQNYSSYLRGGTEGAVKSILNDIIFYLKNYNK